MTPSLKLAETYTDNVFLSPDGSRQSDWITQIIPGISVTANGPRLRLDAFYAPEIVYHAQTEREDKVFHRGNAVGTLELADELLFLEAGAKVDQYDISLQGPLTTSNVNITGNRATAVTSYVSPYLLRNIGSAARAEARFTYSTWKSDEDQPALPDNTARRVLLRLANGPAYRLLTWDVAYSGSRSSTTRSSKRPARSSRQARDAPITSAVGCWRWRATSATTPGSLRRSRTRARAPDSTGRRRPARASPRRPASAWVTRPTASSSVTARASPLGT